MPDTSPLDHHFDNLSSMESSEIVEEKIEEEKEEEFFLIFKWAGFGAISKRKWLSRGGFLALTLVTITAFLEMAYVLFHTIYYSKFSVKFASYPISCGWISQLTLNMVMFYYFQYKSMFDKNFAEITRINGAYIVIRKIRILAVVLGFFIVIFSLCVLMATHYNNEDTVVFNYNDIFQHPLIAMCVRLLAYYKVSLVLLMEYYFLCFTGILCHAFNELNEKFEGTLKSMPNWSNDKIAEKLHSFFLEHLRLSKKLRLLDNVYGPFCLLYCLCIIPSTVFALWALLVQAPLVHYLVMELELTVCLTWLVILLANPIRIRSSVHSTKLLILSNLEIWQEYDAKVSDVARLFLTHLNEDQLGISIWGFVVITKPLILSFISITGTFLIFLLQSHYGYGSMATHLVQQTGVIG